LALFECFQAHGFSEAGGFAFNHFLCGFGCVVAGREAGAAGRDNEIDIGLVSVFSQGFRKWIEIVGEDLRSHDLSAQIAQQLNEHFTGGVFALASGTGVADRITVALITSSRISIGIA